MIVFFLICLFITFFVFEKYIVSGIHSRNHRLLPVVLTMVAVYNFYQIIQCMTGYTYVFTQLEDLLLLQVLYLLIHYAMDFQYIKLTGVLEVALYVSLLLMDLFVFFKFDDSLEYRIAFIIFVVIYILIILIFATYTYLRSTLKRHEFHVSNMLYLALLFPIMALCFRNIIDGLGEIYMSVALVVVNLIIYHLIKTEQLTDAETILKENIYDISEVAMVLFDADCYCLEANISAKKMFPDEFKDIKNKKGENPYRRDIQKLTLKLGKNTEIEMGERYYQYRLLASYSNGRIKGYILSIWDITKHKQETKIMERLKYDAEKQSLSKSRFLAMMSHDLRSPLHAIIGISEILSAKGEVSDENRLLIQYLNSAGKTLLEQVNSILEFSKLESGRMKIVKNNYKLESLIEELANMCVINLSDKPVDFSINFSTYHPERLIGDDMRVREILQNVLSNAVKYTKEGSIKCTISCIRCNDMRRVYVRCTVEDTGMGMTHEQLDNLFKEYSSNYDSKESESTGLGLCIVKQLAELMGGRVSAESDQKSGTKISVSFYQETEEEMLCPPLTITKENVLMKSVQQMNLYKPEYVYPDAVILLADDMEINQVIFKELIKLWNISVDCVDDGNKAVEAVRQKRYDMIFLDSMMPNMTGIEAAEVISKETDTPIILLTADMSDNKRNEYEKHGFSDFLPKPIDMSALKHMIEKYMPEGLRQNSDVVMEMNRMATFNEKAHRKTLEAFVKEVEPLMDKLDAYAKDDIDMYRIKVHGIKGVSGQIGRESLSEMAEIMEMAAKTKNIPFIESHQYRFLCELDKCLDEIKRELGRTLEYKENDGNNMEMHKKDKLFEMLKEGFDNYNLIQIENCIEGLSKKELSHKERELLEKAKEACEDMEYENGSKLFS